MADKLAVSVVGLKELYSALHLLYPELQTELHAGMKAIVEEIEKAALSDAVAQDFAPPGRSGRGVGNLIGSIRSGVKGTTGYVKDTANRQGYSYPARYEYQHGGERAFLRPARDDNRDKIVASIAAIVEATIEKFNEGRV